MARVTIHPSHLRRCWSKADRARRQTLIIDAALDLLHRRGPQAVTMRNVAGRLGVGAMTLYTYFPSQHAMHLAMISRGFDMLEAGCRQESTLETRHSWRGGAANYLRFAIDNPNLYKLMFEVPLTEDAADRQLLQGGFETLRQKVREQLAAQGRRGRALERQATAAAGRFWVALHGLASLAIAGRIAILDRNLDQMLDDLIQHVAPS